MKTNREVTPAYFVYHSTQTAESTCTLFTDENLLTARRAAMTFAESLFGSQAVFTDEDKVDVYLVEMKSDNDSSPTTIARVLQKRMVSNTTEPNAESARLNREHYKRVLLELQCEMAYYQTHSIPVGFGSFGIAVRMEHEPFPINHVTVLFDAMGYAMVAVALYNGVEGHTFSLEYNHPDELVLLTEHS